MTARQPAITVRARGTHETALAGARIIAGARQLVNEFFDGYGAEQTAFTANSTESLNMALKGLLKPGDKVVTTVMEHNSVLRPLYQLEALGVEVVRVGCLNGELKKEECGDGQRRDKGQQEEMGQEGQQQDIQQMGLLDMDGCQGGGLYPCLESDGKCFGYPKDWKGLPGGGNGIYRGCLADGGCTSHFDERGFY